MVEVDLDADGAPLGLATMTFAVLPRRAGNPVITASGDVTRMTMALPDSGLRAPLEASTGIDVRDATAGVVHLPIGDYVRNSLGAVQGGMMATLATDRGRARADRGGRCAADASSTSRSRTSAWRGSARS